MNFIELNNLYYLTNDIENFIIDLMFSEKTYYN